MGLTHLGSGASNSYYDNKFYISYRPTLKLYRPNKIQVDHDKNNKTCMPLYMQH